MWCDVMWWLCDDYGKNKKKFRISDVDVESDIIDALIGLHVFSRNDYIISFFRKEKKHLL